MTVLYNSQLGITAVGSGGAKLRASQLATVSLMAPPTAAGMRASQLALISVIANGKNFLPLGPVLKLPCWQPCTAYGTYALVIRFN